MSREARFRAMFERTYPAVARYVRNCGYQGADAEDLVSGTFEVAWRRLEKVPAGEAAIPWLLATARNLSRNARRKALRQRALVERLAVEPWPHWSADEHADDRREWDAVRAALGALNTLDRELVLLVAWDELEPAQAGRVLGLHPTTARSRLHRARKRLAELLADGGDRTASHQPAAGPIPIDPSILPEDQL